MTVRNEELPTSKKVILEVFTLTALSKFGDVCEMLKAYSII